MKKKIFNINVLTEAAVFAAIGWVLDYFQGQLFGGPFYNGGSIGIASIVILIVGYRRGFLPSLLTGFLMGLLQLLGGIYTIADTWYNVFFQVLLDYILAYPMVSLGILIKPLIKNKTSFIILSSIIGHLGKLFVHYLSGVIFWRINEPNKIPLFGFNIGSPELYSVLYNASYVIPSLIITTIILIIIYKKQPNLLEVQ